MKLFNDPSLDIIERDGEEIGIAGCLKVCCVDCQEDLSGDSLKYYTDFHEQVLECPLCGESVVTL